MHSKAQDFYDVAFIKSYIANVSLVTIEHLVIYWIKHFRKIYCFWRDRTVSFDWKHYEWCRNLNSFFLVKKKKVHQPKSSMSSFKLWISLGFITSCYVIMNISIAWTIDKLKEIHNSKEGSVRALFVSGAASLFIQSCFILVCCCFCDYIKGMFTYFITYYILCCRYRNSKIWKPPKK